MTKAAAAAMRVKDTFSTTTRSYITSTGSNAAKEDRAGTDDGSTRLPMTTEEAKIMKRYGAVAQVRRQKTAANAGEMEKIFK
jgi:hypothetical protein